MVTNILNIKCMSVWWCLCAISNTLATSEVEFMKKVKQQLVWDEKKSIAHAKKHVCKVYQQNIGYM